MKVISEIETPFGKRILIKKRKIKEQMKIILEQNISKNISQYFLKNFEILRQDDFHLFLDFSFLNESNATANGVMHPNWQKSNYNSKFRATL